MDFSKIEAGTQFKIYDRVAARLHELNNEEKPMQLLIDIVNNEILEASRETDEPIMDLIYNSFYTECPNCGQAV